MARFFWYTKKVKDKDGNEVEVQDAFNTEKIIRIYTVSPDQTLVLLDDGHESADYFEVPKPNGKGFEIKKERRWVQSEISLDEEQSLLLRELLDFKYVV